MPAFANPRLIADIGGTYARFALETAQGEFTQIASLRCADHADFQAAVTAYLATLATLPPVKIDHAAVAIANPVDGDLVRMLARTGEALLQIAGLRHSHPTVALTAARTADAILREPVR